MKDILISACHDILYKNMEFRDQKLYCLYDRESPLAMRLADAWKSVLSPIPSASMRQFENPPQPLYRGGLINPDNPHAKQQNRVVTLHNIQENNHIGLTHHTNLDAKITTDASLISDTTS